MKKKTQLAALTLASIALTLSGCTSPENEPQEPDARTRLADFEQCKFEAPDGSQIPCVDDAQPVEQGEAPSPLTGWICLESSSEGPTSASAQVWYHPISDTLALDLQTPDEDHYDGLVQLRSGPENRVYRWNLSTSRTTLLIPNAPQSGALDFVLYRTWIETDTARIQAATLGQIWPLVNGEPYPIQVLRASNATYYFASVLVQTTTDNQVVGFYMLPGNFTGQDYSFSFHYERIATIGMQFDVTNAKPSC